MAAKSVADGSPPAVSGLKRDFHHPYTPYAIQETFMQSVWDICEEGKVGILESPTGTGKSLSLICGSLTWLYDHKRRKFEEGLDTGDVGGEPEWVIEQAQARKRRELLRSREEMETRLARIRAKEKAERDRLRRGEQHFKKRKVAKEQGLERQDEDQYLLEDYESDKEDLPYSRTIDRSNGLSAATLALMEKIGLRSASTTEDDELEDETKIFYCSRTHSQLTQFVNELRRVKIPAALPLETPTNSSEPLEEIKHLSLGSRKNLCINPNVSKLSSVTAINERCLELQQPSTSSEHKCVFLPNKETTPLVHDFRDHTLASIRDIEEIGQLGKQIGICPYYASRAAIRPSEIVTLPYPLLLQKSAREALGLSLKGHVVIIDEAHNLMDAVANIHGVSVSLGQLKKSRAQLGGYLQKFRNKLKGKNRVYVAQVVRLLDSLIGYLAGKLSGQQPEGIADSTELLAGKGVDQINLYKLNKYLQESKLARKVEGYAVFAEDQNTKRTATDSGKPRVESTAPLLQHIQSLLTALNNPSKEGRLFFSKTDDKSDILLRYMLLDPTHHFEEIVSEARAVILAGGTMSPMNDYTNHLFPYLPSNRISTLSCEHVIPKENLVAWPMAKGPTGVEFEFTFEKRKDETMINELGRAVLNMSGSIPDGVVVFFPSYAYLDQVVKLWQVGGDGSLWARLGKKKSLFLESKESASVESVLQEYAQAIDTGKGGLLLSVVGGKMSEGINFSDRLGRGVMIVGLPFPNIHSTEWKAKMEHIEKATVERHASADDKKDGITRSDGEKMTGKQAAREFYENACMRAVNQSIGRAIRHRGDYAVIVLLDKRFANERISKKLPGWIQERVVVGKGFAEIMGGLGAFFRSKKN